MGKKEALLYSQAHRMALGWIDVRKWLPEVGELVLINVQDPLPCCVGELLDNGEWSLGDIRSLEDVGLKVTAWMPLPHSFESLKDVLEDYAE